MRDAGNDRHERSSGSRSKRVDVAGERFATRARLAQDQHRRLVRRKLLDLLAQFAHEPAAADRRDERRHDGPRRMLEASPLVERAAHRAQQLRQRERLLDVVERTEPRGLHRGLDGAVARHHDHGQRLSVQMLPFAQQADAVRVRHPDVEQDEVRQRSCARGARFGRRARDLDRVALFGQDLLHEIANVGLVVNDQYPCIAHARSLLGSGRRASRRTTWPRAVSLIGRSTRTRAPPPVRLSAST